MATAEPASASLGPRYAPDDPTLPKPWKGLIDGSTGILYYWNPETNITQYEKPTTLPPPLPLGPPPTTSTSKLASLPVSQTPQQNGMLSQQGQQMAQSPQHQGQPMTQLSHQPVPPGAQQQFPHQQNSQIPQTGLQGSQLGQAIQQQGPQQPMQHQFNQHFSQHPGQHMPQQSGQQVPQHGMQQMPPHMGQQAPQHQGSQLAPPGHQYAHQQIQYMPYQQSMLPQGQQNSHQQTPNIAQPQPFLNKQDFNAGYPKREETDYQQGNQFGFSPSQIQQTGASYAQNLPAGINSNQMVTQAGQGQQFGGGSVNMQQPTALAQMQQTGTDLVHQQHGPRFQNQMVPSMGHAQQPNIPPVGLKMDYEENSRGRSGNDFRFNPHLEVPNMVPQHPKLASIPMARNQQEMRIDGLPLQNVTPVHGGGLNSVAGQGMHKMYSQASSGPAFPNNDLMKPPSSDVANLSPADGYRQQHEVTVSGDNVPAPFMTFEATGFPPQILREVRYLLRRRSICRTLHCYSHLLIRNYYSDLWRLQNGQLGPFLVIF